MAKRKRLAPRDAHLSEPLSQAPVGKVPDHVLRPRATAPIADVAYDAANAAALSEMADTLQAAQDSGRMILSLPLDQIAEDYLVRDRLSADGEDMATLLASLRARGQQTPIEVVALDKHSYGLISGWRRLQAIRQLAQDTDEAQFKTILAVRRTPADAAATYVSMVEENEIRAGLSYYERARVTAKAVEQRVYSSEKEALNGLFGSVPRAKRSKIKSFIRIVDALDDVLLFPSALSERAGLALARALQDDPNFATRLRARLLPAVPETAEQELALLAEMVQPPTTPTAKTAGTDSPSPPAQRRDVAPGVVAVLHSDGSMTLRGPGFTPDLRDSLIDLLAQSIPPA